MLCHFIDGEFAASHRCRLVPFPLSINFIETKFQVFCRFELQQDFILRIAWCITDTNNFGHILRLQSAQLILSNQENEISHHWRARRLFRHLAGHFTKALARQPSTKHYLSVYNINGTAITKRQPIPNGVSCWTAWSSVSGFDIPSKTANSM